MTLSNDCPVCKARKEFEMSMNIPQEPQDQRVYLDILAAAPYWFKENGISYTRLELVFFLLFYSLSALHLARMKLSLRSVGSKVQWPPITTNKSVIFSMFATSNNYANFRSMLALTSDIYYMLKPIEKYNLKELTPKIKNLKKEADKFGPLRNFFTHFDNVIKDPQRHGVNGPCKTNCGIEYAANTENGFHLVLDNETFYFTYNNKAQEIYFGKSAFDNIFQVAREIYG